MIAFRGAARNLLQGRLLVDFFGGGGRKSPAGSSGKAPMGIWGRNLQKPNVHVDSIKTQEQYETNKSQFTIAKLLLNIKILTTTK